MIRARKQDDAPPPDSIPHVGEGADTALAAWIRKRGQRPSDSQIFEDEPAQPRDD
jgi:hypothetical protein